MNPDTSTDSDLKNSGHDCTFAMRTSNVEIRTLSFVQM